MKMTPKIKLTISEKDNLLQTVTKTVEKQALVKTLEEFQIEANAALTKMIEDRDTSGASGDGLVDDEDEEDDDSADSSQSASDELKGHSKSKKKKHR